MSITTFVEIWRSLDAEQPLRMSGSVEMIRALSFREDKEASKLTLWQRPGRLQADFWFTPPLVSISRSMSGADSAICCM